MTAERERTNQLHLKIRQQVNEYKTNINSFKELCGIIIATLGEAAKTFPGQPVVHGRVKATDSFVEKCIRKDAKYHAPAWQFTDLCGVRVIVLSKDAINPVKHYIENNFLVCEKEDAAQRLKDMEFGYQSMHYIVSLDPAREAVYGKAYRQPIPTALFHIRSEEQGKAERLMPGPIFKAEIQIRTHLQHAWSGAVHDNIYKTEIKTIPQHLHRQSAMIAALVEEADNSVVELIQGVQEYRSYYGAYMSPEEIRAEIAMQRIVLDHDPLSRKALVKIARLVDFLDDPAELERVETELARLEQSDDAEILRELGVVRWKLNRKATGRANLMRSAEIDAKNADTWCEIGKTFFEDKDHGDARKYYRKAFQQNPDYPRSLMRLIECEIFCGPHNVLDALQLLQPNLEKAIGISQRRIQAGMHIPYAWYDIAFFHLLLDRPYASMEAYGKAILASAGPKVVEGVYGSLTEIHKRVRDNLEKLSRNLTLVRAFLRVVLVGRFKKDSEDYLLNDHFGTEDGLTLSSTKRDGVKNPFITEGPVVLVAGSCSQESQAIIDKYAALIHKTFADYEGIICCGGTSSGISGVIGGLADNEGKIRKIAYLPKDKTCTAAYVGIRTTSGTFSALDPIILWADILTSGRQPQTIRVLGIRGGDISGFEYQLALLLGAKVGVVPETGGACRHMADDPEWCAVRVQEGETLKSRLLRLPADQESLRAFLNVSQPLNTIDVETRNKLAKDVHENYSRGAREKMHAQHRHIATWEVLDETFKQANLGQVDQIEEKLRRIGLTLRKIEGGEPAVYAFTEEQLDQLAEMEHGRWVIDRLEDGWSYGERNDVKKLREQLVPWDALPVGEKAKDYQAIEDLPKSLAKYGYEIVPGKNN